MPSFLAVFYALGLYDEIYLLQLLNQVLYVRIIRHLPHSLMVLVQHVQVAALDENSDYALDIFVLHGQMQGSSSVNIFSVTVSIVLLSQQSANVDVPLSCSPVQTCHLLLVNIKCQFSVALK